MVFEELSGGFIEDWHGEPVSIVISCEGSKCISSVGSGLCRDWERWPWDSGAEGVAAVVQLAPSTPGGAAGGLVLVGTLGGGAIGIAVGGALICLALGVVAGCVLVECSSAQRASMAASWS